MNLIIGKNSFIAKSIHNLIEGTYISHSELDNINLNNFKKIYLLSFPEKYKINIEKDFEFEKKVAQNNKELNSEIETLLITTLPKHSHISSTIVRDIMKNKGDLSKLVPNHSNIQEFFL